MGSMHKWAGLALLALAANAMAQAPGDRILAVWPDDGMWYPARVVQVVGADVHIAYDDGDLGVVRAGDFGPVDWHAGSALQCNWQNRGRYFPGVVEKMDGERIQFLYADGDRETMTISRCRASAPPVRK